MPKSPAPTEHSDPFNLGRFVSAQQSIYGTVLAELTSGRKRTHWMWFIFPQIAGLGFSAISKRYAIKSKAEAEHYLGHPVLGARLAECAEVILALNGRSAPDIFDSPDHMKLQSSMTLFAAVTQPGSLYAQVLQKYFQGQPDSATLSILAQLEKG